MRGQKIIKSVLDSLPGGGDMEVTGHLHALPLYVPGNNLL